MVFRANTSLLAVCPWCRSTLMRTDDAITVTGKMAQLLADSSAIQLGTEGYSTGSRFAVVGRLVRAWDDGQWSEWYLWRDDARAAWLTDAAGELAIYDEAEASGIAAADLRNADAGKVFWIRGSRYVVTDIKQAEVRHIDGELPGVLRCGDHSLCIDMEGADGRCATLEARPDGSCSLYLGRYSNVRDLRLTNLRMPAGWQA